jgi:hypothetical protein
LAFVRSKKVNGYTYYQLVRNDRVGGEPRQKVLKHLGPHDTLEAAILAEDRKVTPELARYDHLRSYCLDKAEDIRRSAQRMHQTDYHRAGHVVELLDHDEAYSRERVLAQQYEAAKHSGDSEGAWDRVYGSWEAALVRFSIDYDKAKEDAAYYEECARECQARLDELLMLMSEYPQPIRSLRTLELLDRRDTQTP